MNATHSRRGSGPWLSFCIVHIFQMMLHTHTHSTKPRLQSQHSNTQTRQAGWKQPTPVEGASHLAVGDVEAQQRGDERQRRQQTRVAAEADVCQLVQRRPRVGNHAGL